LTPQQAIELAGKSKGRCQSARADAQLEFKAGVTIAQDYANLGLPLLT
jgi:hypothetical protein